MEKYHIGDVSFIWKDGNFPLKIDNYMQKYLKDDFVNKDNEEIICETFIENLEEYSKGQLLQKNGLYELYQFQKGKFIIYHWVTCRFAFGFWLEDLEKGKHIRYIFSPEMYNQIPLDAVRFFSCAGMHSKLLQKNALIFHASYIEWNGKAILFAGPSGIGKSTQAHLWKEKENTTIINEDRVVIRKKENKWMAYGYPCCGSSTICVNKTLPILAIVSLQQGETNFVEHTENSQKIKMLLTGSECYRWNINEIDRICSIANELIGDIPIIKYTCNKNIEAVKVLKKWMEEHENE